MIRHRHATLSAACLFAAAFAAAPFATPVPGEAVVAIPVPGETPRIAPEHASGIRVIVLPFTPRGAPAESWRRLRGALEDELALHGFVPVGGAPVEDDLRTRRLRDTSLLAREEVAALSTALGAERVLLGEIYRFDELPSPAVSVSCRMLSTAPEAQGGIESMAVAMVEAAGLEGLLGAGGPVSLDRVIGETARRLAEGLRAASGGAATADERDLRHVSPLAPDVTAFFADGIAAAGCRRVLVLPFRDETRNQGAGRCAADLAAWSLLATGRVQVVEAGDAARRLLAAGWHAGQPIGRVELAALHADPGVDAVMMGSVDTWVDPRASGRPPHVALSARLLRAEDGSILWSSAHDRVGDETRTIYEFGNVRLAEALMARAVSEMVEPLGRALAGAGAGKTPRAEGEGR